MPQFNASSHERMVFAGILFDFVARIGYISRLYLFSNIFCSEEKLLCKEAM